MSYRTYIASVANTAADRLLAAYQRYGDSWCKRGGTGAFMNLARKWDRLEQYASKHGYDIFEALKADGSTPDGKGVLDDLQDLVDYGILVLSYHQEASLAVKESTKKLPISCRTLTYHEYNALPESERVIYSFDSGTQRWIDKRAAVRGSTEQKNPRGYTPELDN